MIMEHILMGTFSLQERKALMWREDDQSVPFDINFAFCKRKHGQTVPGKSPSHAATEPLVIGQHGCASCFVSTPAWVMSM